MHWRKSPARAMQAHGFLPDFSAAAVEELETVQSVDQETIRQDLRHLLWASIDNDDSLDLDQLTVAEALPDKQVKLLVAIADVDALVKKNSAIDGHTRQNTTSVYTAGGIFPVLPEKLSTDLTSLNYPEDRPAMVIEMVIGEGGVMQGSNIYRARVRNQAKLAYNSVAASWTARDPCRRPWRRSRGWPESPAPGPSGAANESPAARARCSRAARCWRRARLCRRRDPGSADGRAQPGQGDHRGLHDCGQRCDRALFARKNSPP